MKMKIKTFSQIVEEVKRMPQETNENFTSGAEFEKWLKIRKQHYKDDFESNKHRDKYEHDTRFDTQFSYEVRNNNLSMYNDLNMGMNYDVIDYNVSEALIV